MSLARTSCVTALILIFPYGLASAAVDTTAKAIEEDPGRGSSVNLGYEHNPGNLSSISGGGELALSKSVAVLGSYKSDQLPAGYSPTFVKNIGIGVDDEFSHTVSGAFGLEYATLPDSVSSKGFNLGGHVKTGDFRFGLLIRSLRYSATNTPAHTQTKRKLQDNGIPERSVGLDLTYTVHPAWKAKAGYTKYSYGGATPTELSTVLAARGNASAGLLSAVEGFPTSVGNLGVGFEATDRLDFDLTFTRTKFELAPDSTTATLGANYQFTTAWGGGPSIEGIRQAGQKDGVVIGVQSSYTWN